MIKFAGIRSDELNLVVEHYPTRTFPEKSYEVVEVPGRDADVVIDNGNFKNYRQTYSVFIDSFDPESPKYQRIASKVAEWLLGNPGYQRLEDSYDPDFYRMAYYSGGSEFSNFFNTYGRGSIEFTCAPRRFSKQGEYPVDVTSNSTLINPFIFKADPIYEISGSSITVNGHTMTFGSSGVIIDVARHTAKTPLGVAVSVTSGDYEDLKLGKTNTFGGSYKVTPRWWTI